MISTRFQFWLWVVGSSSFACTFVAASIPLIYPREAWAYEMKVSLTLTLMIAIPIGYWVGQKMLLIGQLNAELQRLVNRDRLTDVATRDFFFKRLDTDAEAYGVSLMVDIDHFKQVNDTYGHVVGDAVIKHVAHILKTETREADIVCRYGGEEFVIFLHQVDRDTGLLVAERMRMSVEASPAVMDDIKVSVTVSIGGSLKDAAQDISLAIQQADAALYKAKKMGRNRTVVDWLPSPLAKSRPATR